MCDWSKTDCESTANIIWSDRIEKYWFPRRIMFTLLTRPYFAFMANKKDILTHLWTFFYLLSFVIPLWEHQKVHNSLVWSAYLVHEIIPAFLVRNQEARCSICWYKYIEFIGFQGVWNIPKAGLTFTACPVPLISRRRLRQFSMIEVMN